MEDTQPKIDFISDWRQIIEDELTSAGYPIKAGEDVKDVTIKYYNLLKRLIVAGPRSVVFSDIFNCPPDLKEGLQQLTDKIQKGENLSPHLSKTIKDIEYDDVMLNDWGIHHFHLGAEQDSSGFIKRTGPLLFARVTSGTVYCVNVFSHGAWSRQEIIEIIHRNWPETIQQYKINRAQPVALFQITDNHIKDFRNAGLSTMVQVPDGSLYAPTGGGYMLDGTSMQAVRQSIQMLKTIERLQKQAIDELPNIVKDLKKQGREMVPPYDCKLEIDGNSFYMLETTNKVAVKLMDM